MAEFAPIRVLAIAGSLREASINRRLVQLAARLVRERDTLAGIEFVEFDALAAIEPFDEDVEVDGFPPGARAFTQAVRAADAVLVATPEYNASIPGQLKNAFDWASRPDLTPREGGLQASAMFSRPAAVVSASNGQFGGVWARDELLKVLRTQGARVVTEPSFTLPDGATAFTEDGTLVSEQAREQLIALLEALAAATRSLLAARAAATATP